MLYSVQGEKEMFVAAELIRPLDSIGGVAHADSSDFVENDKVEVLYKGNTLTNRLIGAYLVAYLMRTHFVFR